MAAAVSQSATRPPPFPRCILRGHVSQIHAVQFVRQNSRLLTGDADGWVVYWKVETTRPTLVWKAHAGPILGFAQWGYDKIITHGRDNTLRIWQIPPEDRYAAHLRDPPRLPTHAKAAENPKPWLLHVLPVNTLNFCAFSMCYQYPRQNERRVNKGKERAGSVSDRDSILVAVISTDDKKIDVYRIPGEQLKVKVPRVQSPETGMVMAVKLVRHQASQNILLLAGYEGGVTAVFRLPGNCTGLAVNVAQLIYLSKPHSQPILSLDTSPDGDFYFTSSADAIIAMHQIPDLSSGKRKHESSEDESSLNAEQQEYKDEEEAATRASPLLPYGLSDTPSDNQRMSLSHILADSPSPSFAKQPVSQMRSRTPGPSNLSTAISSSKPQPKFKPAPPTQLVVTVQPPYKLSHTGHSGQQSLRVRSDGRLLVTGGWDWRIRIYSSKTLKEVAVLKWHEQGVYAVAFGEILEPEEPGATEEEKARFVATLKKIDEDHRVSGTPNMELQTWLEELYEEMNKSEEGFVEAIRTAHEQDWFAELYHTSERKGNTLERERKNKSKLKHWVAAGAKDGKVSLWEVF